MTSINRSQRRRERSATGGSAKLVLLCIALSGLIRAGITPGLRAEEREQVAIAELTPKAEQAIRRATAWFVAHQNADGSWGRTHRVAVTALTLQAFLVQGLFPDEPPYGEILDRGLSYLLREASAGAGYMGASMYEHALATLALSELWGMSCRSSEIRPILERAADVILRSQSRAGGWRYDPRPIDADISVTVLQVVALASLKEAGMVIPDRTLERAIAYVKSLQSSESGGFGYQSARDPGFARTAAGVTSLFLSGDRSSPAVRRGLDYLQKNLQSNLEGGKWFFYGQFYAAQAMYQAGETAYASWYPMIRDALVEGQNADGSWSEEHGTPMAVLVLAVPYRFLPIYQR